MADKKPDAKKSSSSKPATGHMFELEVKVFLVVAFVVVIYLAVGRDVLQSLGYDQTDSVGQISNTVNQGFNIFNSIFNIVIFFSVFFILIFMLGSFYFKHKQKEIVALYRTSLPKGYIASLSSTAQIKSSGDEVTEGDSVDNGSVVNEVSSDGKIVLNPSGENKKWEDIQKHMASMNSSDWRMAILEADILLYDMLDQMGYEGDTIADKLKMIESSDFNTLDSAWRAHKVRNTIAHEGASYEMSYQEAQNTIELYRKVFEEFYFI